MVKITDYIASKLAELGICRVFSITGGGAMHFNDSFGYNKSIQVIYNHHEQACAIGAEGYARASGKVAVVNVTSGPGGLNTLTGLMGQWTDSVPVIYISGQVKSETTLASCPEAKLRQLGDQEINIIDIVGPLTKFATVLNDPNEVRFVLEKAIFLACNGRPGPVWIDVPLDVQGAQIDENHLTGFSPTETENTTKPDPSFSKIRQAAVLLQESKRPVIVAGHGIRISGGTNELDELINILQIPVLTTFNGFDLVPSAHPLFIGRIGTLGTRAGNFALQNSDLIISIGSRNNIRQVSYNWKDFGKNARKIVVDIDPEEIKKPTLIPDLAFNLDAREFLIDFTQECRKKKLPSWKTWWQWCLERKKKYPVVIPDYLKAEKLNPYHFIDVLTALLPEKATVVAGNGTACVALFQAGNVKAGQRMFWNSGCASMGYDLPAAIGACLGTNHKNVVCIAGDGSLQMNIQELSTLRYHNLPVKIFYLNNQGYQSIKQTQQNFFHRLSGANPESGVGFPDMLKVGKALGLKTLSIKGKRGMNQKINTALSYEGPVICEVVLDPDYVFAPKVSSEKFPDGRIISKPLEDMFPFLDRDDYNLNIYSDEAD